MKKLLLCFFVSFFAEALSLDKIFKFNDAAGLKSYIREQNHKDFLKKLCFQQKKNKTPPSACYELGQPADSHCLGLKTEDLSVGVLNEALKSSFLSVDCRKHLQQKRKILIYRQKDFLLPQLKNHWTDKKPFF